MTAYTKKVFTDATQNFEQLLGSKSVEQAIEIQSQYAKKAYDAHVAQLTKLGDVYVAAARNAYKPVEKAAPKKVA